MSASSDDGVYYEGSELPDLGTDDFVVDCRVLQPAYDGNTHTVFAWATPSGFQFVPPSGWRVSAEQTNPTSYKFKIYEGTTSRGVSTTTFSYDTEWHHVALVRTGTSGGSAAGTFKLFVDGALEVSYSPAAPVDLGAYTRFSVGCWYSAIGGAFCQPLSGQIDEFRVLAGTDNGWGSAVTPPTVPYSFMSSIGVIDGVYATPASVVATKLDDFATPDDNTDLDATTGRHGLLPKLGGGTINFFRADGSWAAPTAALDINGLTADTDPDDGDACPIYSADAAANRKVTLANLKTYFQTGMSGGSTDANIVWLYS
jgi:hypothetical protein